MQPQTFHFDFEVDYIDSLGRDRMALVEGTYTYNGKGEPRIVGLSHTGSDYDHEAIMDAAYELVDDLCADDWADWLADQDEPLPTASESTVPMVTV